MARNDIFQELCAPWQPGAAEVLEAYMGIRKIRSMRELEDVTGLDRNKLGRIRNMRPGVSVNFWKRALTNFIALARSGDGKDALQMLVQETLRIDTFKYQLTEYVKLRVGKENILT